MSIITDAINLARQDSAAELHVDPERIARMKRLLEQSAGDEIEDLRQSLVDAYDLIDAQQAIIEESNRRAWRPTPAESAEWLRLRHEQRCPACTILKGYH